MFCFSADDTSAAADDDDDDDDDEVSTTPETADQLTGLFTTVMSRNVHATFWAETETRPETHVFKTETRPEMHRSETETRPRR